MNQTTFDGVKYDSKIFNALKKMKVPPEDFNDFVDLIESDEIDINQIKEYRKLEMNVEEIRFFEEESANPNDQCPSCDDTWLDLYRNSEYNVTDSRYSEKTEETVCFGCWESSSSYPHGTVFIMRPLKNKVERWTVYEYEDILGEVEGVGFYDGFDLNDLSFETYDTGECPISFGYVKTDGWRGHYEPRTDKWHEIHTDGILGWSANADKLKQFNDLVLKMLWDSGIDTAIVVGTTSNLFYQTYTMLSSEPIPSDIDLMMKYLASRLRNPKEYTLTAITGKSEDFDEKDDLLYKAYNRLQSGESFESIIEDIRELD